MRGEVHWLRDMVVSCEMIGEYVEGITYEEFQDDYLRRDAVCYRLSVIGECVGQVLDRVQILLPEVLWQQVKGMRNVVLHDFHRLGHRNARRTAASRGAADHRTSRGMTPPSDAFR